MPQKPQLSPNFLEILLAFLRLGCTSFGGPIAHLGYFRAEFVERRQWLSEQAYADLVALSQFLPGPASSQTGFGIGLMRGGLLGGLAAWIGFTTPSALLLLLFALSARNFETTRTGAGLLHGLKLMAVAVIAQAVLAMAKNACPDKTRATIAAAALALVLAVPAPVTQFAVIAAGGVIGFALCRGASNPASPRWVVPISRRLGLASLALFFLLLALTFLPARSAPAALFGAFYRSGALVFGGGHVVLPLLRAATVGPGWVSDSEFLAGYGAAQAVPGPLFTVSAYLGAMARIAPGAGAGAIIALCAIFLPGLLCFLGALPLWQALQTRHGALAAMRGVNAAVVGLLAAALYNPVFLSSVKQNTDAAVAASAFILLTVWRMSPAAVAALSALSGLVLTP